MTSDSIRCFGILGPVNSNRSKPTQNNSWVEKKLSFGLKALRTLRVYGPNVSNL
jgi:hypothetical protein